MEQRLDGCLEIVNLALSGHVDARTVQAFLNFWGFVRLQDLGDNVHPSMAQR